MAAQDPFDGTGEEAPTFHEVQEYRDQVLGRPPPFLSGQVQVQVQDSTPPQHGEAPQESPDLLGLAAHREQLRAAFAQREQVGGRVIVPDAPGQGRLLPPPPPPGPQFGFPPSSVYLGGELARQEPPQSGYRGPRPPGYDEQYFGRQQVNIFQRQREEAQNPLTGDAVRREVAVHLSVTQGRPTYEAGAPSASVPCGSVGRPGLGALGQIGQAPGPPPQWNSSFRAQSGHPDYQPLGIFQQPQRALGAPGEPGPPRSGYVNGRSDSTWENVPTPSPDNAMMAAPPQGPPTTLFPGSPQQQPPQQPVFQFTGQPGNAPMSPASSRQQQRQQLQLAPGNWEHLPPHQRPTPIAATPARSATEAAGVGAGSDPVHPSILQMGNMLKDCILLQGRLMQESLAQQSGKQPTYGPRNPLQGYKEYKPKAEVSKIHCESPEVLWKNNIGLNKKF